MKHLHVPIRQLSRILIWRFRMASRKTSLLRWISQICIILVLLVFVLFVFFGPTGKEGSSTVPSHNHLASSERKPFALFTPASNKNSHGSAIGYTNHQLQKIRAAIRKSKMTTAVYLPKKGLPGDYLMEIRIYQTKKMIEMIYPNFSVLESENPIQIEPKVIHQKKEHLALGTARLLSYKRGGYHISIELKHSYVQLDSDQIHHQSKFIRVANSLVLLNKYKSS